MSKYFKEVQAEVLKAFQEEIPSVYYSDKTEVEFNKWKKTMDLMYHDLMHFPPKLFSGQTLLDLGAGTGENTVYFSNWGAKCTLVEMNDKAHEISKKIFENYSQNKDAHTFINKSLFDFQTDQKFDIVHSRGVFAHTNDPEKAFNKLASCLKPGGYLIYGDGNKSGNFQNMLQRMVIFNFADKWDEMVNVAEKCFKEDLDRAQKFANRTRRCIIFDKWVVPRLTQPSVSEVLDWFNDNNITLYSSYPPIMPPILSDSLHHFPKFNIGNFTDVAAFTEAFWLIFNEMDAVEVPKILTTMKELSTTQFDMTDYIDDFNLDTKFEKKDFINKIDQYKNSLLKLDLTSYLINRSKIFFDEVKILLDHLENKDLNKVVDFCNSTKELFRGSQGNRHIDFIGNKKDI